MCNQHCTEPSLDELFGDFPMQLLMRRDGVTESDVRTLLCQIKDIRAVASGGTKRDAPIGASKAQTRDRGDTALRSRAEKSSEPARLPRRFI
jgi:hypothetical protein